MLDDPDWPLNAVERRLQVVYNRRQLKDIIHFGLNGLLVEILECLIAKHENVEALDLFLGDFHLFAGVHHFVGTLLVEAFYDFGELHEIFFLFFKHYVIQVALDLVASELFKSLICVQRLLIFICYQNALLWILSDYAPGVPKGAHRRFMSLSVTGRVRNVHLEENHEKRDD